MTDETTRLSRRFLRVPVEILVAVYLLLDSLAAPLFGPPMRWLSSLRVIQRLEGLIARLPPYVILVLLVVPFGIAELAKIYALLLIAEDHVRTGVTIFIGAYVVSILVCERTFQAGKVQLMTIGWFARLFAWVVAIKERILGWFRDTAVWRVGRDVRERSRTIVRRLQVALGATRKGTIEQR